MFVVCRLQELRRARPIVQHMCSNDLQKIHYSVYIELLSVVPARFGVPENMLTFTRQFHEDMRTENSEQSEWFDVTQGLRQRCVLSLLLFTVSFAAMICTVLVRFSESPDMSRRLVHFEESPGEN